MEKRCKFCKKIIHKAEKKNQYKKLFCNKTCQQEWWRYKRNKTGRFTREQRAKGIELRKNNHLSEQQLQLCYGGLLGDSSLKMKDNGQIGIKFGHCEKQLPYLEWKKKILEPFIVQNNPTVEKPETHFFKGDSIKSSTFYSYNSIIHQDITDLYPLFYRKVKNKSIRHITMKTFNLLTPFALLIWFLDDGTLTKDKECRIYTLAYDLSQHKVMKKWFWHKYRIEVKIYLNITRKRYYLSFNVNNSKHLQELFQPFLSEIPECMHYKFLF